jgi:CSLREA domain-containing protein
MGQGLRSRVAVLAGCLTGALMLACAPSALANAYTVTRTDDPTPGGCHKTNCSLREAVIAANAHHGPDTIMLQGAKTYNLTIATGTEGNASSGDLDILDNVKISHTGTKRATINAHKIDRVFEFPPTTSAKATFLGLVIEGGKSSNGGGIEVQHGSLTLIGSVVRNNRVTLDDGGGISVYGGFAKIVRSSITGNRAADEGGGIFSGAHTVILDSTVSGNFSVISGGGVANHATLTMRNDTVANNSTEQNGGGISSFFGSASLNDVTIARNKAASAGGSGDMGGGIFTGSGTFTISNSLIALNTLGGTTSTDPNCSGTFTSKGHNMRTSNDAGCVGFTGAGDFVNANPKIGPLANNGGPTETIALLTGSPAINKASPQTSEKRDQRGHKRDPKHPDIGAYEAPG